MAKKEAAVGLDEIQKHLTPVLKQRGFRKSGRTYNRVQPDGVVHVVNLQTGTYPIGHYEVPGIRESFYGKLTVNLGVFVPCVAAAVHPHLKDKSVIQEYSCDIRSRLGLLTRGTGLWWPIEPPYETVASEISALLESDGIPFLEQFGSLNAVLDYYEIHRTFPETLAGRSALIAGIAYAHLGSHRNAAEAFQAARTYAEAKGNHAFVAKVSEIEKQVS